MEPTSKPTASDPVQAAPPVSKEQPTPSAQAAQPPRSDKPVAKQPSRSTAELAAAHARAHKRLTIIETVGVVLLVFLLLSAAAVWAYYQQESNAADRAPYSTNEYQ